MTAAGRTQSPRRPRRTPRRRTRRAARSRCQLRTPCRTWTCGCPPGRARRSCGERALGAAHALPRAPTRPRPRPQPPQGSWPPGGGAPTQGASGACARPSLAAGAPRGHRARWVHGAACPCLGVAGAAPSGGRGLPTARHSTHSWPLPQELPWTAADSLEASPSATAACLLFLFLFPPQPVGSWFPGQELSPGLSCESAESSPLTLPGHPPAYWPSAPQGRAVGWS